MSLHKIIKYVFWLGLVKFLVKFVIGLQIKNPERIPKNGPCIIISNHNSHLDTVVLFSLFKANNINKIRPVAAADYFLKNPIIRWFSLNIIGIIPMERANFSKNFDPFAAISASLARDEIIIFFPEGSRGEPEIMQTLKKGIARLACNHPDVPVIPIFIHGLGKTLPKGEWLLVPFLSSIYIGGEIKYSESKSIFMQEIEKAFNDLKKGNFIPDWR